MQRYFRNYCQRALNEKWNLFADATMCNIIQGTKFARLLTFVSWHCERGCLSLALSAVDTIIGYCIWRDCELCICVLPASVMHLYDHVKVCPVDSWGVLDKKLKLSWAFVLLAHLSSCFFINLSLLHWACSIWMWLISTVKISESVDMDKMIFLTIGLVVNNSPVKCVSFLCLIFQLKRNNLNNIYNKFYYIYIYVSGTI